MEQKVACITGAGRGIGLALVKEYLRNGHLVIAVSRTAEEIEVNSKSENSLIRVSADITSEAGIAVVKEQISRQGELNVLIHNAGQLV
ncbi:MAG TPA: SDR family NAD(P)-dependent oxidoreductase, partial [Cryomorphaceae bacterium]|nr:SDR family NAD(P)-dependent oxidoreductase [Cryomorphaceae bacterium]